MGVDAFNIVGTLQAGHFKVEEAVAEGGFAVVYRALHLAFRAPVALKCLKIPGAMTAEQREIFLEKFRAEAELLFRLSSITPHVVRPLQVGTLDVPGRFIPFLALEWLDGASLDAVREKRAESGKPPMAIQKVVKIFTPVARALSIAHRLSGPDGPVAVIHCDLKPDNIFVATAAGVETVKILDFGIARVKDVTSAIAGRTSGNGGSAAAFTPGYGAPEQWVPDQFGQTGPWTDVWGLAISMVEVLLGRPAITGALGTMMSITVDPKRRPTPRALGITVSDGVERAFARALTVDPASRIQDVQTFWTELETALGIPPTLRTTDDRAEPLRYSDPPPAPRAASVPARAPSPVSPQIPSLLELDFDAVPRSMPRPSERLLSQSDLAQRPPMSSPGYLPPIDRFADFHAQELDLARGLSSQPSRPRPPPQPLPAPLARGDIDDGRSVLEKLTTPLKLVGLALLVAVGDQIYLHLYQAPLSLGPVRPFWISAGLVGVALLLATARILSSD